MLGLTFSLAVKLARKVPYDLSFNAIYEPRSYFDQASEPRKSRTRSLTRNEIPVEPVVIQ